ncbi:hypothetical protein [Micromonospora endophytica]|nr:hypothetical protein [Micromonospora endophytica]
MAAELCGFHLHQWLEVSGSTQVPDTTVFDEWVARQEPCASYGDCAAVSCSELARSPLLLCEDHEKLYRRAGRPGGARLPSNWGRWLDRRGDVVPVAYDDETAFRRWCRQVQPAPRPGQISLYGMKPLIKAELKWGLHAYTQRTDHTRWWMHAILRVVETCRDLGSLDEFDRDSRGEQERVIVTEMLRDLEIVYVTPTESKEAGYIDFEHFGRRIPKLNNRFDLTQVPQRWLRDLLWEHLADLLRSADCPRGRGTYFAIRVAVQELGYFLEARAPGGGHDPSLLSVEHVDQFVADQRRRARDHLPSLRPSNNTKTPTISEITSKSTFDALRRMMRAELETGRTDQIGMDRKVVWAFPLAGKRPFRPRSPYADDTARALVDQANLEQLEQADVMDRGYEIFGRRSSRPAGGPEK